MLRLAFDFIITWRETRTRPNAYPSPLLFVHFPDPFKEFLSQTPVIPCPV